MPRPSPLYARATRWRITALSLWLGRMALAPLGLVPYIDPLLALPMAIGLIGAVMGPIALWPTHRRAAIGEAAATALGLIPAVGWLALDLGAAPTSEAGLPLGTAPGWLPAAGLGWLIALAFTGHQTGALRPAAWTPSLALMILDLPRPHRALFALSPRLAEQLAPLATVLAIFALARMERALRSPPTPTPAPP